jgi:SAM-dependent methyltransferase
MRSLNYLPAGDAPANCKQPRITAEDVMSSLQEFDQHKETYRTDIDKAVSFSGQSHDFFTRVKADYLIDLFKEIETVRPDGRSRTLPLEALDVGCGHGHIHPYLVQSGVPLKLRAVDVATTVVEEARRTNPTVEYKSYEGDRLPYPDQSFDVAYTIAVMHHVPPAQWPAFLDEMRRVVRPGGLIAIFEHNPINPLTQWIVRTCPIDENAVLLGSRKLSRLVAQAKLVEIESHYILFTPLDGPRYRKFDKMIGWLPLGAQYYVSARVPQVT